MTDRDLSLRPEALLSQTAWMTRLARALIADPERADDAVQNAWVAVLEHPERRARNPRAWLAGVLKNVVRQERRSESRRIEREEHVEASGDASPAAEIVERAELHRSVVHAVCELDEPWRSTLLLRYFDDLSAEQIARQLGLPSSTVRSRVHTSLERLRTRLDGRLAGGRSAWCVALAALAEPGRLIVLPTSLATSGALAMTLKTAVATAVLLTIGFGASHAYREGNAAQNAGSPGEEVVRQAAPVQPEAARVELASAGAATARRAPSAGANPAQESGSEREPVAAERPSTSWKLLGRVVDRSAKPVAGARVFVGGQPSPFEDVEAGIRLLHLDEEESEERDDAPSGRPDERYVERELPYLGEWRHLDREGLRHHGGILGRTLTSDAEGFYRVDLPQDGRVYVTVLRDPGIRVVTHGTWHERQPVEEGKPQIVTRVETIPTARLEVVVHDTATQKPLVGIAAELHRGDEPIAEWTSESPAYSRTVELPVGETNHFELIVQSPEWARTRSEFTLLPGATRTVEVWVDSGEGQTGRVVDVSGSPVEGAFVFWGETIEMRGGSHFRPYEPGRIHGGVRTDAEGRFTLPGTAARISAWHAGSSPVTARAASASLLTLAPGATIRGVVHDDDGAPAAGKEIRLDRERIVQTDARGAYEFAGVEAGLHGVVEWPRRFVAVRVAPGEVLDVPSGREVAEPRWELTSGGVAYTEEDGGIVFGLGRVFSVSEWGSREGDLHTGRLRYGTNVLMSGSGLITQVEIPASGRVHELGSASITLQLGEDGPKTAFVLPELVASNEMALHWGERFYGERESGEPRTFGPLRSGRYVVIAGNRIVTELELAAGEARTIVLDENADAKRAR